MDDTKCKELLFYIRGIYEQIDALINRVDKIITLLQKPEQLDIIAEVPDTIVGTQSAPTAPGPPDPPGSPSSKES